MFKDKELRKHLPRLDYSEIDELLLHLATQEKVNNLINKMKGLDEVTRNLRHVDATIFVARKFLDTVLKSYSVLSDCLDPGAHTSLSSLFT